MSMKRRKFNKLLLGAATGIIAGSQVSTVMADDEATEGSDKHVCKGRNDCKGQGGGASAGKNACKGQGECATSAKHDCKSQNDCKGQGGCAGTAGKNSCKGEGGCAVPIPESMSDHAG